MTHPKRTTRRSFVTTTLGGATAAALLGACGGSGEASNNPSDGGSGNGGSGGGTGGAGGSAGTGGSAGVGANGGSGGSAGSGADGGSCTVYPQQMEGPFYLDGDLVRSDITEGKPGTPLKLIVIVQSAACTPIAGAAVDVWQCDAGGVYSGHPGQLGGLDTTGQTFLRGTQVTDADGRVEFVTIYPGWYPGRTTHIHFKVRPSATTEATSQLYFPETITSEVYTTVPYAARGQKDTSNAADGVNQGNVPPLLEVVKTASGYDGTLTITVAG